MAPRLESMGRVDSGDGRWSIWVVAWVAHAISSDPSRLYDANIFHPERDTLAYSEANVGAGVLALPAWLATSNPYAAHNSAIILGFALSVLTMFALARRICGHAGAALAAAILYAFCPFVFARTAHIQLLMIWGIPLVMLCLHRLVDEPTPTRGVALGLAVAATALSCAYYGVLAGLMCGAGVLTFSVTRRLAWQPRWWLLVALAAVVAVGLTLPFFLPYLEHQEQTSFSRPLDHSVRFSANWQAWFASSAHAHRWLHPYVAGWSEVLFPGFVAIAAGLAGAVTGLRRPRASSAPPCCPRDVVWFYATLGTVILWLSFGPDAFLYTIFWKTIPIFGFLRAPARFGIGVVLALAVLASVGLAIGARRARFLPWAVAALAAAELVTGPLVQPTPEPFSAAHRALARLPRGAVLEIPFFERRIDFHRHTEYMLPSTVHWQRLVNGYSDYASPIWARRAQTFRQFPAGDSLGLAQMLNVRYVVLHEHKYSRAELAIVRARFAEHASVLSLILSDDGVELYELRR